MQGCQELFHELLKTAGCKIYMSEHLVRDGSISKAFFISHMFNALRLGVCLSVKSVLLQVGLQVQWWYLPASFIGRGQREIPSSILKDPGEVLTFLPRHPKREQ